MKTTGNEGSSEKPLSGTARFMLVFPDVPSIQFDDQGEGLIGQRQHLLNALDLAHLFVQLGALVLRPLALATSLLRWLLGLVLARVSLQRSSRLRLTALRIRMSLRVMPLIFIEINMWLRTRRPPLKDGTNR